MRRLAPKRVRSVCRSSTGPGMSNGTICRMPSALSISAVLPAYNEEAIIERTVGHVAGVLAELTSEYEVIVTNDGSRDRTGEVLARLQAAEPDLNLRVVTHATNC